MLAFAARAFGSHHRYVRGQIDHGLKEAGYGCWGFSPADIPDGGYSEYGVDALGMQEEGYDSKGVVTPHASFRALPYEPAAAVASLTALDRDLGAYDDRYGFRHSVDTSTGRVSDFVLALDQGVVATALAQQPRPGLLQRPFRTGCFRTRVRPLPAKERFSI